MTWSAFLDAIPKIAPVFTAGAAVWGAVIATRGLAKWKQETVGKRKLELAEDVVSGFHEIRDVLTAVRFPGSWGNQGETLPRDEGEDDDAYRVRSSYYTPIERIVANATRFSDLEGKKYRVIAYFGQAAAKPFEDLSLIKAEIITASRMLANERREDNGAKIWSDLRAKIGWVSSDKDEMKIRIDQMVAEADAIFGEPLRKTEK